MVRLPVHLHELMAKVKKTEADLRQASSCKPSNAELADASGITQQKLAMLMNVRTRAPALGARVGARLLDRVTKPGSAYLERLLVICAAGDGLGVPGA